MMHTAALAEDLDPDRLSFVRTLRVIRRQVIAAPALFPPEQIAAAIRCAVEELLTVLLPKRRLRAFPARSSAR